MNGASSVGQERALRQKCTGNLTDYPDLYASRELTVSQPSTPNGGYLRGRAKSPVTLRDQRSLLSSYRPVRPVTATAWWHGGT
jgi:hypothetical protein